jgi:hypothetical protein
VLGVADIMRFTCRRATSLRFGQANQLALPDDLELNAPGRAVQPGGAFIRAAT